VNYNDYSEERHALKAAYDPGRMGYDGRPCRALMGHRHRFTFVVDGDHVQTHGCSGPPDAQSPRPEGKG
jgi:hypothetical protein